MSSNECKKFKGEFMDTLKIYQEYKFKKGG